MHDIKSTVYDIKPLCVTEGHIYTIRVTSQTLIGVITLSIFMASYTIHMLSPYCFHDNITTIPGISPTIFDTTATVSLSSHRWHTHLYRCVTLSMTSQQVCKSSHLAYVWHHTQFNHITFTLYDINDDVLWHHKHSIHDIRYPLHDITSTL